MRKNSRVSKKTSKKGKAKKPVELKQFLVSGLRKLCQRWPAYYGTLNGRKKEVELYQIFPSGTGYMCYARGADPEVITFWSSHAPKLGRRIIYQCEKCEQWFLKKDKVTLKNGKTKMSNMICVDHIEAVTSKMPDEWDWNTYVEGMFPQGEGKHFQVLCRGCHGEKTKKERANAKEKR
jgi:hypothetical protein